MGGEGWRLYLLWGAEIVKIIVGDVHMDYVINRVLQIDKL